MAMARFMQLYSRHNTEGILMISEKHQPTSPHGHDVRPRDQRERPNDVKEQERQRDVTDRSQNAGERKKLGKAH